MAFRLQDFKKTTRKASAGSRVPPSLYPHQLKDKKMLVRLDVAIRMFDSSLGKRRGEMNAQSLVDFFGDHRLARGIVACLGQFYRYETRRFGQVVGPAAQEALAQAGIETPAALRAFTYRHVNTKHNGFLAEEERASCYRDLGAAFGVTAHEWETLLYLDAEDNQVLTRAGATPRVAGLVALYNFHSLETPLRRAKQVALHGLTLSGHDAAEVRAFARWHGVKAVCSQDGQCLTLTALEAATPRRTGQITRCLLGILQSFGVRGLSGTIDALLGTRSFRVTLTPDLFKILGPVAGTQDMAFRRRIVCTDRLHQELLKQRTRGQLAGWRIKRHPEPIVSPMGIVMADFRLSYANKSALVIFGTQTAPASAEPTIMLPLRSKHLSVETLRTQFTEIIATSPPEETPALAIPSDIRLLCDRAAAQGMVSAQDAQRTMQVFDESPLIEWVRRAADPRVRYLPGIGLCSEELVSAIAQAQPAEGA